MTSWNLPDGVRECDIPGNRPGDYHHASCPANEDADPVCTCGCLMEGHPKDGCAVKRHLCEGAKLDEDPDCTCADLDSDDKADAAEARIERDREDF